MSTLDWAEAVRDERFAPLRRQAVLVTGGAGFIGSHLVDALRASDCRVTVFDNLVTGRPSNLAHLLDAGALQTLQDWKDAPRSSLPRPHQIVEAREDSGTALRIVLGDLRDAQACRTACEGAAYVFHQAALGSVPRSMEHPAETLDVNVAGTARLFEAARDAKVRRIVYASSSSVYGDSEKLPKKEGEEGNPLSPYALSKVLNERLAEIFTRCYEMQFIGLRYFNVYGPRQDPDGPYAAVIPRFFLSLLSRKAPVIYGDGEQTRDFTFVEDAVRANIAASIAPMSACGRCFNVAGGFRITINHLASLLRELTSSEEEPIYYPPREGDVRHSHASISRSIEIGFTPRSQPAEGLRLSCSYYEESCQPAPR